MTPGTRSEASQAAWLDRVRPHLPIALLTMAGFATRLAWLLHAQTFPVSDFNDYRTLALGILDHGQFGYPQPTAFFLPVHPTFLALFASISRSDTWLAFSMILVSTLSIVLVYLVARRVVGSERGALFAASIFAFLPTFFAYSPVLATEHLFIALMLAGILMLTRLESSSFRGTVMAGLMFGLAVLTRGEAVFYIPAGLLWVWVGWRGQSARSRLKTTLIIGSAMAVVVIPWYVRNAVVVSTGAGLSSSAGLNFYFAHNDSGNYGDFIEGNPLHGLPAAEASRLGWELGFEHIRAHPLNLIKDTWIGTQRLFAPPDYAIFWSTQGAEFHGDPDFYQRPVRFSWALRDVNRVATMGLLSTAALSLLALPAWRRGFVWLIVPLAISSWLLRTVIYWAQPRYAYFITVMVVFAAAVTVDALVRGVTSIRGEDTVDSASS